MGVKEIRIISKHPDPDLLLDLWEMSEYVKTLKIPIHYLTTKRKLSTLDRLTARLTYAVRLFCEEAGKTGEIPRSRKDIRQFSGYVAEKQGCLQASFSKLRT